MKNRKELIPGIIVSFAFAFMVCIYAPLELYFNNVFDFWFDVYTLLPMLLILFLGVGVVLSGIQWIMFSVSKKVYDIGLLISFGIYIISYIQGNFLVGNLPVLDGSEVDWELLKAGRIESLVLWCVVFLIVIFIYKKWGKVLFVNMVQLVCICMTLMLLVTGVSISNTKNGLMHKPSYCMTYKNILQMSKDTNYIILVLDTIDGKRCTEILEERPDLCNVFSDFTYYSNTMGGYPFTKFSIPYIISGIRFENERDELDYFENAYVGSPILNKLAQKQFLIGMYGADTPLNEDYLGNFENVIAKNGSISTPFVFMLDQLKLAGLRYAPFDLKKLCVFNPGEFGSMRVVAGADDIFDFTNSNKIFYDKLQNESIKTIAYRCFKFIHLEGAHVPLRYNKDMEIVEQCTYDESVEGCIKLVDTYLNKLKNSGVYDNSVIIVMSDHGYESDYKDWHGRQDPVLFVKGINEHHEFNVSKAPVSYDDLQVAYERLMNGNSSTDIFDCKEGDVRERRYLWHDLDGTETMIEYIQTGWAWDDETMYPTGNEYYYDGE